MTENAVAIDFGRKGMAYCSGTVEKMPPMITSLELTEDVGKINTAERASKVSCQLFERLPASDVYILEAQPAINRSTCMLESALAAAIRFGKPDATVIHVPTIDVKVEFDLPSGHDNKKRAATKVAGRLLGDSTATRLAAAKVVSTFCESKRRHDMADSLLMLMWYARKKHGKLLKKPPKHKATH